MTDNDLETSKQWWDRIKNDKGLFFNWITKQVAGEFAAVKRISEIVEEHTDPDTVARFLLTKIVSDENKHGEWMLKIAASYGVDTSIIIEESKRYWDKVEPLAKELNDFQYSCAVAAHAEEMRLERIKAIAEDDVFGQSNPLIQKIFKDILVDETFHASAFALLAGETALVEALDNHLEGMEALGLVV